MKLLYNTAEKNIITWWNEDQVASPDHNVPNDDAIQLYDLPDIHHPDELEYSLFMYFFDEHDELTPHPERMHVVRYDHTTNFGYKKTSALHKIDNAALDVRQKLSTSIQGQDAIYIIKENEARNFIKDGIDSNEYPFLTAESIACDIPIDELVRIVIRKADECNQANIKIECVRLKFKNMIKALKRKTTKKHEISEIVETATFTLGEI